MGGLFSNFGVNAAKIIENSIAKVGQELKSITVWLVTVGDKLEQIADKLLISVYTLVAVLIGIFFGVGVAVLSWDSHEFFMVV